jgi:hypothetical protein
MSYCNVTAVDLCGYGWTCVAMVGRVWLWLDLCGYGWTCVAMLWTCVAMVGPVWLRLARAIYVHHV